MSPVAGVHSERETLLELQEERARLRQEIDELRRQLAGMRPGSPAGLPSPVADPLPFSVWPPGQAPYAPSSVAPGVPSYAPSGMAPAPVPSVRPYAVAQPVAPPVVSSDQGLDFGAVSRLSPDELDTLPYGLITLDAQGRVVHYNDTEARLVGLPRERVLGRSFFDEVAPCTRVREFKGRFEELARDPVGVRVQSFDFVFRFARAEQHVSIVMTPARVRGQFHVALLRRAIVAR